MESVTFQVKPHGNSVLANRIGLAIIPALIVIVFLVYLRNADQENAAFVMRVIIPFLLFGYAVQLVDWHGRALGLYSDLQLDDRGLTWRNSHWRWSELSTFKLYGLGQGRRFIRFEAPEGDGGFKIASRRFQMAPGRLEKRITDQFDMPLEEIVAKLNETRRHALGGKAEVSEASGAAGTETIYFIDIERANPFALYLSLLFVPLLLFSVLIDFPSGWTMVALLLLFLATAVAIALGYLLSPATPTAGNFLKLDDGGLTHARRGKETSWSWHEVSPFRISEVRLIRHGLTGGSTVITAEVPNDARLSRLRRWTNRILFRGPLLLIPDIYLGRPDDIVADLNAHRSRAMRGGNATNGPQAPAE